MMNLKKITKNRLFIGVTAILFSFLIVFLLAPAVSSVTTEKMTVYKVKESGVKRGDKITEKDITEVTTLAYDVASNVLTDKEVIIGQYAKTDFYGGENFLKEKLSDVPVTGDKYLYNLPEGEMAISISLKSFAKGLSGKLEANDIVSVIALKEDEQEGMISVLPDDLHYVKVLSVTNDEGKDKGEGESEEANEKLPKAVTLLAKKRQAMTLAALEATGSVHVALVYRGDSVECDKYLKSQEAILKQLEEEERLEVEAETDMEPEIEVDLEGGGEQ